MLDLGLPDVDGIEVLRAARTGGGVPVVVLTARSEVADRIRGLELGADDYVTKPFSPTEVVLRVQAVLHRTRGGSDAPGPPSFGAGRLRVDEARHEASWDGTTLDLTPTEFGLLAALAAVPGRAYSRYELVNRVRGYDFAGYERSIDSHVKNLRHKLHLTHTARQKVRHSARATSRRTPTGSRRPARRRPSRPYRTALLARRPGRSFEANPDPDIVIEEGFVMTALGTSDEANASRRRVDDP